MLIIPLFLIIIIGLAIIIWSITAPGRDRNQDHGTQDRRNIAAAYIGSLPNTRANQDAIERLREKRESR